MSSLRAKPGTLLALSLVFAATTPSAELSSPPCFESSAWPEADLLFRGDPFWLGADSAFSVALGNSRSLWLFGDTWVDSAGTGKRDAAQMVRNSVAIQTGQNPSNAEMQFFWDNDGDRPAAFFEGDHASWYWPGHGAVVNGKLIVFLNQLQSSSAGMGFESVGWGAVLIDNPADSPSEWAVRKIETPKNRLGVTPGFAGVLSWRGFLYAFGSQHPVKSHPIFVARWPHDAVSQGDLKSPEWWGGIDAGWVTDNSTTARWPILENGQSEMTFHFDEHLSAFVATQTVGFGRANVVSRYAENLTGPWTRGEVVFSPPQNSRPNISIYAAKSHPQLTGADSVISYATNTMEFAEHFSDEDIYYPHFVRLKRCDKE